MEDALEPLVNALNQADSLPFLFVGSGVSRRYLGHENFHDLLEWAAGLTDKPLQYYLAPVGGDLPRAASEIAAVFYETWWNEVRYLKSRTKWQDQCTEKASPLKFMAAARLEKAKIVPSKTFRAELRLLATCHIDGIITTNYDTLLEETFSDFDVFVGQQDLLLSRSYQLGEIYKIHGSVAEPNGIVLCAEDYERFADGSAYLVAKLMSVFVEHPIVFLGYSLTDPNIRVVLTSLLKCLSPEKAVEFKDRFIFVDYDPSITTPIIDDHTMDLGDGRVLRVLRVRTASFAPVFEVLATLERKVSLGLLRRVAKSVVGIVHSTDPTRFLSVAALNDLADLSNRTLVVGVGDQSRASPGLGFRALDRYDLIADTVKQNPDLPPYPDIVLEGLPIILQRRPQPWVPVFKYVRLSGLTEEEIPPIVRAAMDRELHPWYSTADPSVASTGTGDLIEAYGLKKALNLVQSLPDDVISIGQLHELIENNLDQLRSSDGGLKTAFAQAASRLDRLRYGPDADPTAWTMPTSKPARTPKEVAPRSLHTAQSGVASDAPPAGAAVRLWASSKGLDVAPRGRISRDVLDAYRKAHPQRRT